MFTVGEVAVVSKTATAVLLEVSAECGFVLLKVVSFVLESALIMAALGIATSISSYLASGHLHSRSRNVLRLLEGA
jgi:hypothetical protein